jgi:hypothetical protein
MLLHIGNDHAVSLLLLCLGQGVAQLIDPRGIPHLSPHASRILGAIDLQIASFKAVRASVSCSGFSGKALASLPPLENVDGLTTSTD